MPTSRPARCSTETHGSGCGSRRLGRRCCADRPRTPRRRRARRSPWRRARRWSSPGHRPARARRRAGCARARRGGKRCLWQLCWELCEPRGSSSLPSVCPRGHALIGPQRGAIPILPPRTGPGLMMPRSDPPSKCDADPTPGRLPPRGRIHPAPLLCIGAVRTRGLLRCFRNRTATSAPRSPAGP